MDSSADISMLAIVAITLALMLVRPGHLAEGYYALAGAVGTLLVGAVGISDVPHQMRETGNILLFLAGMLLLTGIIERAHLFHLVAEFCAYWAKGHGRILFIALYLLGALVTLLLSLDVTVILLTPIILSLTVKRAIDPIPFLFGCVFVANIGSLALPVSNLTNLLMFDGLGLTFREFAGVMWLPNVVAVVSTLAILMALFWRRIPRHFSAPAPELASFHVATPWTGWCGLVLIVTLAALIALGIAGLPLWWAAVGGAATLLATAIATRRITIRQVTHDLSLPVFLFVLSMTIVVEGFERTWLEGRTFSPPSGEAAAVALSVLVNGLGSNVVNNVPMTLLSISIIQRAPEGVRQALAFGALVGANIGPALTTYGSLATILWLSLIRRHAIQIKASEYLRVSLVVVPAVLVLASLALLVSL